MFLWPLKYIIFKAVYSQFNNNNQDKEYNKQV